MPSRIRQRSVKWCSVAYDKQTTRPARIGADLRSILRSQIETPRISEHVQRKHWWALPGSIQEATTPVVLTACAVERARILLMIGSATASVMDPKFTWNLRGTCGHAFPTRVRIDHSEIKLCSRPGEYSMGSESHDDEQSDHECAEELNWQKPGSRWRRMN